MRETRKYLRDVEPWVFLILGTINSTEGYNVLGASWYCLPIEDGSLH